MKLVGGDARSHCFEQSVQVAHVVRVFGWHVRQLLQASRVEAVATLAPMVVTATSPHGLLLTRELISERVEGLMELLRLHDPLIPHLAEHTWQDLLRGLVDLVGRGKQHLTRALGEDRLLRG